MVSRIPFYILVCVVFVVGVTLCWFRHVNYNVPFTNEGNSEIWEIEARVQFNATGDPIKVSMAKPSSQKGYTYLQGVSSAVDYGVTELDKSEGARVEWSKRSDGGQQILYYTIQMLVDEHAKYTMIEPGTVEKPNFTEAEGSASRAILKTAISHSSDEITLTREIIKQLNDNENSNASLLVTSMGKEDAIIALLATQGVFAKEVQGFVLEDGRRRQLISSMLEVWTNNQWQMFDPKTGLEGRPESFLVWNQSAQPLLDVEGGEDSEISFSFISQEISPQAASNEKIEANNLLNFSIHSLPIEGQSVFKTIMLIPIGALIVVILRVLVGLKTSGTFMPVLIALAFVQTELVPGIVGFLSIVGVGLIIRSYLSKLNLLLVARISAVIISVVLIISILSVIGYNIGLTNGLSVTLFPMIILSWTIERMSILWEEEGPKEVFVQGGGSLLTAILVYLAMTNPLIEHLTFNFIGIQFIILAVILVLGNYTGYRLSELFRFKTFIQKQGDL